MRSELGDIRFTVSERDNTSLLNRRRWIRRHKLDASRHCTNHRGTRLRPAKSPASHAVCLREAVRYDQAVLVLDDASERRSNRCVVRESLVDLIREYAQV